MTTQVRVILDKFDRLSDGEKKELALEILRRSVTWDWPELTDEFLIQNADELFRELDRAEAAHEGTQSR
jgi:hypothetical protein